MLEMLRRRRQRESVKRCHRFWVPYNSRSSHGCSITSIKLYCDQELYYRYIWQGIPLRYSLNSYCFEECPYCHNRTWTPFSLLILASTSSKRFTRTKISLSDRKQSETNDRCVSMLLFPHFCIATRPQQDVRIEKFLSLASCLQSSVIGRG